jgi:prolipoprotein diacylglyceryltransferase
LWLQRHKVFDGQLFLIYITVYGIGQFLLEFLRFGPLPHIQCAALAAGLVGATVLLVKSKGLVAARSVA